MILWLLTSEFPPDFGGGISTYCHQTASALSGKGVKVTVFTRANEATEADRPADDSDITVVRLHVRSDSKLGGALGYWHLASLRFAEAVIARVRETGERPDAIEVQDYGGLAYFLCKEKLLGAPELADTAIIIYAHTPIFELSVINEEPSYLFPQYWIGQAEKFCYRAADSVLFPSAYLREHVLKQVACENELIRYPFAPPETAELDRLAALPGKVDLLYAGRFEQRKGVLPLVAGMQKLWDAGHAVTLTMMGSDTTWAPKQVSMRETIEKRYAAYIEAGLLTLKGAVPLAELSEHMAAAKAVVVPSLYENYPYVCMQAMGLAKPIIASVSGGQAEMAGSDGSCGRVFDWADPDSFGQAVLAITSMSADKLAATGLRSRARILSECGVDHIAAQRIDHLERTIHTARQHARKDYPFAPDRPALPGDEVIVGKTSTADWGEPVKNRLSVVIPFYNLADYLPATLASIDASDYGDKEVIIVNDGSSDQSARDLLEQLARDRPDLRIETIPNGGLANARNVGAQRATGEFIAFVDADDLINSDYFSSCVDILNRYQNVSFAYSWLEYFDNAEGYWVNFDTEFPYQLAANMLAAFLVVRRSDFLTCGQNNPAMQYGMEDFEAWIRMLGHGCKGVSIPRAMVQYRVREDSMARQFNRRTVQLLYEQMVRLNPGLYRQWGDELFMLINANGPGYLWSNGSVSHPKLGYIADNQAPVESAMDQPVSTDFNVGELIRIKQLATRPLLARILRWGLRHRIDQRLKRWF